MPVHNLHTGRCTLTNGYPTRLARKVRNLSRRQHCSHCAETLHPLRSMCSTSCGQLRFFQRAAKAYRQDVLHLLDRPSSPTDTQARGSRPCRRCRSRQAYNGAFQGHSLGLIRCDRREGSHMHSGLRSHRRASTTAMAAPSTTSSDDGGSSTGQACRLCRGRAGVRRHAHRLPGPRCASTFEDMAVHSA